MHDNYRAANLTRGTGECARYTGARILCLELNESSVSDSSNTYLERPGGENELMVV